MKRALAASTVAFLALAVAFAPVASGQGEEVEVEVPGSTTSPLNVPDQTGGETEDPASSPDASTTITVAIDTPATPASTPAAEEVAAVPDFGPVQPAARPHPYSVIETQPCGEWRYFDIDASYQLLIYVPPICDERLTCGAERIDDHYLGRISGATQSSGQYGAYLTEVVSSTAGVGGGVVDVDVDGTNTSVLAAGLGGRPDDLALATFNWCQNDLGEFERTDPLWQISFGWDTSFDAEYDRSIILAGLLDQLSADLDLYNPEIAAAPPVAVGHTYVKFPTWLWIDEPLESVTVSSQNATVGNVQVSLRATLATVDFHMGDIETVTCAVGDLIPYVEGDTHPIDDVGPCRYTADKVGAFELSATLTYIVEERVRQRLHRSQAWPATEWQSHDANRTLSLDPSAGRYEVHELLSLNVNEELELVSD